MKLININIGIKIDNSEEIVKFILEQNADIITIQEIIRHLSPSVFPQYQSKALIESKIQEIYPHSFFGPLWVTEAMLTNGELHRDFGGLVEQGNEILSKTLIDTANNEHFYKAYSYARDWTNWENEDHARALIIAEIVMGKKRLQIITLHGIWTRDKKGDKRTEEECAFVVQAAMRRNLPTIITGDFNLYPDTSSIAIINNQFRNLISEFDIKTTRPNFKDNHDEGNNVVDYIFVNDQIKVKDFQVIHTNISDHYPLYLDFDIN